MKTKLLIAILAGVVALVGVGYYFVKEDMAKKQKEEEARVFFTEKGFDMSDIKDDLDKIEAFDNDNQGVTTQEK